jgi:ribokinase
LNQPCVLSLGSINLDIALRVERLPASDEESMAGRDLLVTGGGRAANVAFLARKIGAPSLLLARMGEDDFGAMALRGLQRMAVDLRYVRRNAGEATGVAMIAVRPNGEETMLYAAGANEHWRAQDTAAALAAVAEAVTGSVLVADLEPPTEVVTKIARACRDRGFAIVLDPSPPEKIAPELYRLSDCITPNRVEASALAGFPVRTSEDALRAAITLHERGTPAAFVKLQDGGCVMVADDGARLLLPPKVPVIDKTGAGDAFAGALAVALLSGWPMQDAARLAVAAGAAAVRGYGAQPSYPDRPELERLLALVRTERIIPARQKILGRK